MDISEKDNLHMYCLSSLSFLSVSLTRARTSTDQFFVTGL